MSDNNFSYARAIESLKAEWQSRFSKLIFAYGDYQIEYGDLLAKQAELRRWYNESLNAIEKCVKTRAE